MYRNFQKKEDIAVVSIQHIICMEKKNNKNASGFLRISVDVVSSIAEAVLRETPDIVLDSSPSMVLDSVDGHSSNIVSVTVKIKVKRGVNIRNICENLQQKIKNNIQSMTGVAISTVNIVVSDMIF